VGEAVAEESGWPYRLTPRTFPAIHGGNAGAIIPNDDGDYQQPGERADLVGSKFANMRHQENASGDTVQDFGGDPDEPDSEGSERKHWWVIPWLRAAGHDFLGEHFRKSLP